MLPLVLLMYLDDTDSKHSGNVNNAYLFADDGELKDICSAVNHSSIFLATVIFVNETI